jgi:hypothetical protein
MVLLLVLKEKEKQKEVNKVNKVMKSNRIGGLGIVVVAIGIFVTIAATAFSAVTVTTTTTIIQSAEAVASQTRLEGTEQLIDTSTGERSKAPVVVSGDNIYVTWWNGTAGQPNVQTDVMFRASNDGGETFGDKINLSNTTDADSWRVEVAGEGDTVVVSWWETNQTSDVPVARMSTDGGQTFGAMLMLGSNGTLSSTEEGAAGEGGETTTEEEAVGGAEVAE